MLADICNCEWVPFSSPVKLKHGKLAGYQHTASFPDYHHYRIVCGNFMLTEYVIFFDSKMAMYCDV